MQRLSRLGCYGTRQRVPCREAAHYSGVATSRAAAQLNRRVSASEATVGRWFRCCSK